MYVFNISIGKSNLFYRYLNFKYYLIGVILVGVIQHWKFVHYLQSIGESFLIIFNDFSAFYRYYKDSALCQKCILDDVPSNEKLSKEQTTAILRILGKFLLRENS